MQKLNLEAMLLQRCSNFSWITDGASSYVGIASDIGPSSVLITENSEHIVTTNIESSRLKEEEGLSHWSFIIVPWNEDMAGTIKKMVKQNIGSDFNFPTSIDASKELAEFRRNFDDFELERFKTLGELAGLAIERVAYSITPGMSELEISAHLNYECLKSGILPIVNLIAADKRISKYGHPIPTNSKLNKFLVLVLGARKWGLVASATRFVHFGPITNELRDEFDSVSRIAASFIKASTHGTSLAEVFHAGQNQYRIEGYDKFWNRHHQGGLVGFVSREVLATETCNTILQVNNAFAWNPKLINSKSEDTYILTRSGVSAITQTNNWPMSSHGGIFCSDILIR